MNASTKSYVPASQESMRQSIHASAMHVANRHRKRSLFITFEGIDGSGKSTQLKRLIPYLKSLGLKVIATREPGGGVLGERLRTILLDKQVEMGESCEALLMLAARHDHIEKVIRPALDEEDTIVLCDRFNDSLRAYQGYGGGMDLQILERLIQMSGCDLQPDMTIWLDPDEEEIKKNMSGDRDRFETKGASFLSRVRKGYSDLFEAEPLRIHCHRTTLGHDFVNSQIQSNLLYIAQRSFLKYLSPDHKPLSM